MLAESCEYLEHATLTDLRERREISDSRNLDT
jgi:hypothetical protein